MKSRRRIFRLIRLLAGVAFMTILFLSEAAEDPPKTGGETGPDQELAQLAADREESVRETCAVQQTMRFLRCGHSVTRRLQAPDDIKNKTFSQVQQRYPDWQIDHFSADAIDMSREMMLYCPMHWVLTVNDAGEAVLTKNEYGDGMALKKTYPKMLDDFSEEKREKLLTEIGFDTREEAEEWLAAD